MPYVPRKPLKKKRGHRAPTYIRCGKMVVSDASKALAIASSVKRLLNVEIKNHDFSQTAVTIPDGAGTIFELTNIPQGDTGITRDGANVKITSIYIKGIVILAAAATTTTYRIVLVEDKQTNQAIYVTADLLATVANVQSVVSPLNLDNQFRFNVLYDRIYHVDDSNMKSQDFKIYKKVNKRLRFDASTPDITDLRSSSYSLLCISTEPTNAPSLRFEARLRFVDN